MLEHEVEEVLRDLEPMHGVLPEVLRYGIMDANQRLHGYSRWEFPSLRPPLIRASIRTYANDEGRLPEGWKMRGNSRRNELYFENDAMSLRFLKERQRTYPGGVPVAGHNRSRSLYWSKTLVGDQQEALLPDKKRLLLLWDYDSEQTDTEFTLRVVHPTGVGRWGEKTPIDLSIEILDVEQQSLTAEYDPAAKDDDQEFFVIADEKEERAIGDAS